MPITYEGVDGLYCDCRFDKTRHPNGAGRADGLLEAVKEGRVITKLVCDDCGKVYRIVEED